MEFIIFVLGLIIGWAGEWGFDLLYWRRRQLAKLAEADNVRDTLETTRARVASLQGQLAEADEARRSFAIAQSEIGSLRLQLAEAAQVRESLADSRARVNDLEARLAEADKTRGALTTAQAENDGLRLQLTEVAQVRESLAGAQARVASLEAQLAEARVAAQAESDDLKAKLAEADKVQGSLAGAQAQIAKLQAQLAEADKAHLSAVRAELDTLRARLTQIQQERESVANVNGIGLAYEQRLNQAGIFTCAQLAELTPDQVREIVAPKQWQKIDPEAWIAEARQLAKKTGLAIAPAQGLKRQAQPADTDEARQALVVAQVELDALRAQLTQVQQELELVININGIGPAYERRLNQAGIFTCTQLAELTPERVREIIAPKKWQKIEPETWIAQARHLAKRSRGFTWTYSS